MVGDESMEELRPTQDLWVLPETALCALKGCVPCSYKIILTAPQKLDGEKVQPPCRLNVRPELCPRQSGKVEQQSWYSPGQKVLVVGDGDFTFSLALAKSIGEKAQITCTSYQSEQDVKRIYKDASKTLEALGLFDGAKVYHDVDATDLDKTLVQAHKVERNSFDRIIFNFPCVADAIGKDGQSEQLEENKLLISNFLKSASSDIIVEGGEIHIVHKTKQPFSWWEIPKMECNEYTCVRNVVFDRSLYPGYIPRKVGENKSFPVFDAVVHCFRRKGCEGTAKIESEDVACLITPSLLKEYSLIKLTPRRIRQFVSLLQLPAKHDKKRDFSDFSRPGPSKPQTKKQKRREKKRAGNKKK